MTRSGLDRGGGVCPRCGEPVLPGWTCVSAACASAVAARVAKLREREQRELDRAERPEAGGRRGRVD